MKIRTFLGKLYRLNLEKIFIKLGIDRRIATKSSLNKYMKSDLNDKAEGSKDRDFELPVKFIHIGYPKGASTALQQGFFGIHPQILHLGCGNSKRKDYWDDHGYISREINLVVEIDLRFRNQLAYDKKAVKETFEHYFGQARENRKYHAIGLSNENFCFNWHRGIDTVEKAKRLYDIFGDDTQILMVVRNQKELVESLYKESIRFGYRSNFNDYIKYLWQYKDRNFYYDFHFDKVYKLYADKFGKENINILFFEDFKNNQSAFLAKMSNILHIDIIINSVPQEYNKQLSNKELYIKREINSRFPHTFGKGFYDPFDTHRYIPYYLDELKQDVEFEDHFDYQLRNDFCELSKKLAMKVNVKAIELKWDTEFGVNVLKGFNQSNQLFYSKIQLPQLKHYKYLDLI